MSSKPIEKKAGAAYQLTFGASVVFESDSAEDLALHVVERFAPEGEFPSPNPLIAGWALVCDGVRLQGLRARRWLGQQATGDGA